MNIHNWKMFAAILCNINARKLNRRMVGMSLEQTLNPVAIKDIKAYAHATRDQNPLYCGENALVPPFFFFKSAFPLFKEIFLSKNLKLNILRMIHGEQELIWHKPIVVGDRLTIKLAISDIQETPAGELLKISGQAHKGEELLVESVSSLLIRAKRKESKISRKQPKLPKEVFRAEIKTSEGQQLEYAKASGDTNFIHTSYFAARLAGLPRTIMHGLCVMAMTCSELARIVVSCDIRRLSAIQGRFARPVLPGQTLTLVGYESAANGEIPFSVFNSSGQLIMKNGILRYKS